MAQPNYFNAPIPGQSLTQDPDAAGPWEQPPKFTTVNQALDHMFQVCTTKGFINKYDTLLREDKKFYVDVLVGGMLGEGFVNGLWTVDTMMLMVEPMIGLMVWVAAQLDRSPSFSGDTGYEDRTGFEELEGMVVNDDLFQDNTPAELPQEQQGATESPLVQGNQSPLVTGAM